MSAPTRDPIPKLKAQEHHRRKRSEWKDPDVPFAF
jgi:hypothetical protein